MSFVVKQMPEFLAMAKGGKNLCCFFKADTYLLYGARMQAAWSCPRQALQRLVGLSPASPRNSSAELSPLSPGSTCLVFLTYRETCLWESPGHISVNRESYLSCLWRCTPEMPRGTSLHHPVERAPSLCTLIKPQFSFPYSSSVCV